MVALTASMAIVVQCSVVIWWAAAACFTAVLCDFEQKKKSDLQSSCST